MMMFHLLSLWLVSLQRPNVQCETSKSFSWQYVRLCFLTQPAWPS